MGDVDLWELADGGNSLTVNKKWLQHLQDRLLGEDGHPRKVSTCTSWAGEQAGTAWLVGTEAMVGLSSEAADERGRWLLMVQLCCGQGLEGAASALGSSSVSCSMKVSAHETWSQVSWVRCMVLGTNSQAFKHAF
jgi:hypothetical protein